MQSAQNLRSTGEMHDGVDPGKSGHPIRSSEIAQRNAFRGGFVGARQGSHRGNVRNRALPEPTAQRPPDEAARAGDQHLAPSLSHAIFQPCLPKKRTALRAKYAT
jgi:hypothetical protein